MDNCWFETVSLRDIRETLNYKTKKKTKKKKAKQGTVAFFRMIFAIPASSVSRHIISQQQKFYLYSFIWLSVGGNVSFVFKIAIFVLRSIHFRINIILWMILLSRSALVKKKKLRILFLSANNTL